VVAGGDRADGGRQLPGGDGPAHQRRRRPARILGQQQHPGRRPRLPNQPDQLGHARTGHLGVGHQHVRLVREDRLQGRGAVAGQGDHLEVVLGGQHHAQTFDEGVVVVGQHDPDRVRHRPPYDVRAVRC
jgi:hypothetical protein